MQETGHFLVSFIDKFSQTDGMRVHTISYVHLGMYQCGFNMKWKVRYHSLTMSLV